jgi:hypothetical protein
VSYIEELWAEIHHLTDVVERLTQDNARLRAELCERTQATSPIRLLNDLRAGLDATRGRLVETEHWK